MNVTFLIGNGFDLNLGLKTKYSDFVKEYVAETDGDADQIKNFKKRIKANPDLWSSAELALGQYTGDFSGENAAEDFVSCYDDFRYKLANYLINEEKGFNIDTSKDKFVPAMVRWGSYFREEEKRQIEESLKKCDGGIDYNFISYNYTTTLDKYLQYAKTNVNIGDRSVRGHAYKNQIKSLIHVHGTVEKDMIMGVDNLSQLAKPEIFDSVAPEYLADIIKIENNKMCGENTDSKAHTLLNNSDFIYIYGMSLGKTDATWWRRICEIMNKNKNAQTIIYKYDAPEREVLRRVRVTFDNEVKKNLTYYCDFDQDVKAEIEQRIHVQENNLFKALSPSL